LHFFGDKKNSVADKMLIHGRQNGNPSPTKAKSSGYGLKRLALKVKIALMKKKVEK
jgi:hypothetical protein